jgi:dephospho-CoA kinase
MPHRPLRIGLTGSIGMGKSVAARMFARLGVPVFDADAEVHRLQGPGGALLGPIEARFPGTTGGAGVDRAALGGRVIGKAEELKALEAIVHPAVRASRQAFLRRHGGHAMLLFDIPLLFETGGEAEMDLVVVVSAPLFLQRRRVLRRRGMTSQRFARLRASQMPDHVKRARADVIIGTARPKWQTFAEIERLVTCVRRSLVR